MSSTKIDFLYLNEEEMVKAGVTDMHRCVEVMGEVFDLMGRGDYVMGGKTPFLRNFSQKKRIFLL